MDVSPENRRLLAAAAEALGAAWSADVHLYLQDPIRTEWGRHRVLLCNVDGPPGSPAMVVIKAAVERNGTIFNEWAALEFLNRIDAVARLVPTLYAGDEEEQLIVIEDVGGGPSLHRLLQSRRRWAEDALVRSMQLLADVHAATRVRQLEFDAIRAHLPRGAAAPDFELSPPALMAAIRSWGDQVPADVEVDLERAARRLDVDGSFHCLTFHDSCPVNRLASLDGMRAVDLEMAGFRHPLVDGAYAAIGHLRCSVRRLRERDGIALPLEVAAEATDAYRRRIVGGYPEYADRQRFDRDLAAAAVVWMAEIMRRMRPLLVGKDPSRFFKVTARQRVLAVLDAAASLPEVAEHYPSIGPWASAMRRTLLDAWPPTPPLLVAAAFENGR